FSYFQTNLKHHLIFCPLKSYYFSKTMLYVLLLQLYSLLLSLLVSYLFENTKIFLQLAKSTISTNRVNYSDNESIRIEVE
ncbi:hypothetical protein B7987_13975, partial [Staphylococcus aureus]